mmetsp:Transcript_15031/g.33062  ORF Transcript_15031/g.33062 Transcript_15031/m.33062 type:complete len:252 (-) Transcript_15031:252-1007(-)
MSNKFVVTFAGPIPEKSYTIVIPFRADSRSCNAASKQIHAFLMANFKPMARTLKNFIRTHTNCLPSRSRPALTPSPDLYAHLTRSSGTSGSPRCLFQYKVFAYTFTAASACKSLHHANWSSLCKHQFCDPSSCCSRRSRKISRVHCSSSGVNCEGDVTRFASTSDGRRCSLGTSLCFSSLNNGQYKLSPASESAETKIAFGSMKSRAWSRQSLTHVKIVKTSAQAKPAAALIATQTSMIALPYKAWAMEAT